MNGKIRPASLDRVEPRDRARLSTAWVGDGSALALPRGASWISREVVRPRPSPDGGPVLVMLGASADADAAREHLAAHAASGARVYVLVETPDAVSVDVLRGGRALVRTVPEVPASAAHAHGDARVWFGDGFSLRLDDAQREALRQVFVHLFWHAATSEAWYVDERWHWRAVADRPFDATAPTRAAPVRLEAPGATLAGDPRGALVRLSAGPPPTRAPRRLWYPAGPDHHASLARLLREGSELVWADLALADALVRDDEGEVLLPGARSRLRVTLSPAQSAEMRRVLECVAPWRFVGDLEVGDASLRGKSIWLDGATEPASVIDEQRIEVADVQASSLREVWSAAPESVPEAHPLARSVRYRWRVRPPRVPAGAVEDPLVTRWREIDKRMRSRCERLGQTLQLIDLDRARIHGAFARLGGEVLGFERERHEIGDVVESLSGTTPSRVGVEGAREGFTRLAAAERRAESLQRDQREAERVAREEDEREAQRAEWLARVDGATRDLPGRREALARARATREELARETDALASKMGTAQGQQRKDLAARRQRLGDDVRRAAAQVKSLEEALSSLEATIAAPFEFRPSATSAPKKSAARPFVPSLAGARPDDLLPEDSLPSVGALREHKGRRYLVIEDWAALDDGERAAARLGATLVAAEDA